MYVDLSNLYRSRNFNNRFTSHTEHYVAGSFSSINDDETNTLKMNCQDITTFLNTKDKDSETAGRAGDRLEPLNTTRQLIGRWLAGRGDVNQSIMASVLPAHHRTHSDTETTFSARADHLWYCGPAIQKKAPVCSQRRESAEYGRPSMILCRSTPTRAFITQWAVVRASNLSLCSCGMPGRPGLQEPW